MFKSLIKSVGAVEFPSFQDTQLYMYEIDIEDPKLPKAYEEFNNALKSMMNHSPIKQGKAFVTIDSRHVIKGTTHRRPGPHVDGNFIFDWANGGGGGWLTGTKGRQLKLEDHLLQYHNEKGGTLISSSFSACKAWRGDVDGIPKQGGDCSHLILPDDSFILNPNEVYLMNSTCVHESLPLDKSVNRTLMRITLPPTEVVIK